MSDAGGDDALSADPTALRIILGTQLRRLRESVGITPQAAGNAIRASHAKISRLELGRVGLKERDVVDLLGLYGVTDADEQRHWIGLVRRANTPGWWQSYSDILPSWFEPYLRLEQAAQVIRTYQVQLVPGLLQSEPYARAVTALADDREDANELERRVHVRMTRQKLLAEPDSPTLWAVVEEAALRRLTDTPSLLRSQVEHLLTLSALPAVTLQVMPLQAGGHPGAGGPFTILRFAEADLPDVVYLEQLTSSLYLDKRSDVERHIQVMDRICVQARTPEASTDLLHGLLRSA
ncbi:helix-turn-helix domain-containing protein [Pseudonocardia endophytica]|uniref:Helix-turn-helix protein n=1 Tax=Pseudonocardia endophytica TaxID=401976 RepID=A0A4R1HYI7_PSEEN|nr:helix-turn-helix transcriptional regulator [Pseudonocardia endophytica]TCK26601.1 helix-turn-helix protein [Pseudonocardia endophytica]